MKVLFVDTSVNGHHVPYLKALCEIFGDSVCFLPGPVQELKTGKQIVEEFQYKKLSGYLQWLRQIKKIARQEKVDAIHFLYGDIFYRFFGIGLFALRKYKILVTFHHFRKGLLHDISLRHIFASIDNGIVHTASLAKHANTKGIHNIDVITYPVFEQVEDIGKEKSSEMLGLSRDVLTLLCFGGTRRDKGLDILLEALEKVTVPVQLIIAGKAEYFTEEYITAALEKLNIKYVAALRFIADEEIAMFFSACDIVVLPYRRVFDGASGPLGIGCQMRKMIIGPSHGSVGSIISENHLGLVFETENTDSLADAISRADGLDFVYDQAAEAYRTQMSVSNFQEKYLQKY